MSSPRKLSAGDSEKELEASPGKEVESADSLIDLKQNEERTMPTTEKQHLETLEKESDEPKLTQNSEHSEEKMISKEEVYEYLEESLCSLEAEYVKSTGILRKSLSSLSLESSESDESSKIGNDDICRDSVASEEEKESVDDTPEKMKKTVRLRASNVDNISDYNASTVPQMSLKPCPSLGTSIENSELKSIWSAIRSNGSGSEDGGTMMEEAWDRFLKSYVYFKGKPVGTLAAMDPIAEALNYNQV